MDKRIEDYLPLYLGCEGLYLASYGVSLKKQVKAKLVGITSQGKPILICYDKTGKEWGRDVISDFYEFILAIRPLSAMTVEIKILIAKVLGYYPYKYNELDSINSVGELFDQNGYWTKVTNLSGSQWTKMINCLRKNGYDCDGLMGAGLAIDKTKLETNG